MSNETEKIDPEQIRKRKINELEQQDLFGDLEPSWADHWWGMPSFDQQDVAAQFKIVVNFSTFEDVREFAAKLNARVTTKTKSMWYPPENKESIRFYFDDETD